MKCNKEECILRLERIASSAKLLSKSLNNHDWYENCRDEIISISKDIEEVKRNILNDSSWAAADR